MRADIQTRHPLAALLLGACLAIPAPVPAAEDDGRGVTVYTRGAGDAFAGDSAAAEAPLPPLDNRILRELSIQASLPEHALEAAARLRRYVAQQTAPETRAFLRRLLVRALITGSAPAGEIVEQTDLAAPEIPQAGSIRSLFYLEVAQMLLRRGEAAATAVTYARNALDEIPPDEVRPEVRGWANAVLGQALLANGECRPAIEVLSPAVAAAADSQPVLRALGAAHEACGEPRRAIEFYVRALGVYGSGDSSAAAPLRRLYAAEHGSLAGLDERIREAYEHSMKLQVFDERRYEAPMPAWAMENTEGDTVRSEDLEGSVIVLDFWGSWCGPCRMELPHFQEMYEKYRDRGVVFYGVNWERVDRSRRKATALAYLEQHGFDFPNVYDLDDSAAQKFQVASFPTVYLIDHTGKIRYRNIGFTESISDIMSLQIESLLEEKKRAATAKK